MKLATKAPPRPHTAETRTGKLVEQLVEAVQQDLDEVIVHLEQALQASAALVGETRGVNGLSSFLKAQGQQLEKMIQDIREEAEAVERKLFGIGRPEIVERVNQDKVEELREAV